MKAGEVTKEWIEHLVLGNGYCDIRRVVGIADGPDGLVAEWMILLSESCPVCRADRAETRVRELEAALHGLLNSFDLAYASLTISDFRCWSAVTRAREAYERKRGGER